MKELLDRCLVDDPDAWREIWSIVAASFRRTRLRRLMVGVGIGSVVDDAKQEFYLFLREDAYRRLRVFRGEDELAFRTYIGAVGKNFLLNYRASRVRADGREDRTRSITARSEAIGITEPQLMAVFREFLTTLSADERRRLRIVLGSANESKIPGIGTRTLRRWHRDLAELYRDRML